MSASTQLSTPLSRRFQRCQIAFFALSIHSFFISAHFLFLASLLPRRLGIAVDSKTSVPHIFQLGTAFILAAFALYHASNIPLFHAIKLHCHSVRTSIIDLAETLWALQCNTAALQPSIPSLFIAGDRHHCLWCRSDSLPVRSTSCICKVTQSDSSFTTAKFFSGLSGLIPNVWYWDIKWWC